VFVVASSSAYSKDIVQLNRKAKPIAFSGDNPVFNCDGFLNKDFVSKLYSFAKKYAFERGVDVPSKKSCEAEIMKFLNTYPVVVSFNEIKGSYLPDEKSKGVSIMFNVTNANNNKIWIKIFNSGYEVGRGVCLNVNGDEIDSSNC